MHQTLRCLRFMRFFFHRQGTRKALPKYQQNQSNCDILVNYRSILLKFAGRSDEVKVKTGPTTEVKSSSHPSQNWTVWPFEWNRNWRNWHPNFGSQLIHPYKKLHMFRDPPKKTTFGIHLEMMCLQKWTMLVPPQVWKNDETDLLLFLYLFAILKHKRNTINHQRFD